MAAEDAFPPDDFDPWAASYDKDVDSLSVFPFAGYRQVLETLLTQAAPEPGMHVLDLGTGTGNLARCFAQRGCELWCTDFSEEMLKKAREKVPQGHLLLHDLRSALPAELDRQFDRIVSAYVFHHFALRKKVELCRELAYRHLAPGGGLFLADISFQDRNDMDTFAVSIGELWEEEPYWLANEALAALSAAGLKARYLQVSACAGVYAITA